MTHPGMAKNPKHWRAYQDGLISDDWPLLKIVAAQTLLNMDGLDHKRLRKLIQKAFTARRVEALRPRIEQIVHELLDELATHNPNGALDLRSQFAFQVPMTVICELYGVDNQDTRDQLAVDTARLLGSQTSPAELLDAHTSILGTMAQLITAKRRTAGDDLTTSLIAAHDADDQMSEDELVSTLFLMLIAGHETTQNLLSNAIKDLLENPHELERILAAGPAAEPWHQVVEESLRLNAPAATTMFLYAVTDVTIAGVTIRAGEPVMIHNAAIGRDESVFPNPHDYQPEREDARQHRAFGHGVHHCLGAPLARLEGWIALRALHQRFVITAAEKLSDVERVASLSSNAPARLPVFLADRELARR